MKPKINWVRIYLLALLVCSLPACAQEKQEVRLNKPAKKIMFGVVFTPEVNGRTLGSQIKDMKELGVSSAKFWLDWNWVEPRLAAFNLSSGKFGRPGERGVSDLSLDFLKAHPELIEEYAFPERPGSRFQGLVDWSMPDRLIKELKDAGIAPFPLIGDAIATPFFPDPGSKDRVSPEPPGCSCSTNIAGDIKNYGGIGKEQYIAHLYLFSAGIARRYSHAPAKVVWWNTENELNWAYIHTTVAGWRCGKAWSDNKFLKDLLCALHEGVKAGNPDAGSTMNVNIHDPDWILDLKNYAPCMDALGLGSYPNYIFAWPLMDWLLADAVKQAHGRADRKPVFVLETGYASGPKQLGWNENRQARYISRSVAGAIRNGAEAYIYFKLDDTDLAIPIGRLQQVENHWGLVRLDGSRKPAFYAYSKAIASF